MQRKIWFVALLAAAILMAGSTAWAGDFYVIAGGGSPVGTKITSVPYTINKAGFYFLDRNLDYSSTSGAAITVEADDVTIDLMGFALTGPGSGSRGIYMHGRSNVEVRNGTVRGFYIGIEEDSSASGNKHHIINVRANLNSFGIWLKGNNLLIKNCAASDNTETGLEMGSGLITGCEANYNKLGIAMSGPGSVLGNTAFSNSSYNFYLGNGIANSILVDQNCAFSHATNYFVKGGTTGVVITGNNSGTP
jgi:hypothetical protein